MTTGASVTLATRTLLTLTFKCRGSDPNAIVQRHIKLLHQYNEIKDIGMGLFGLIADRRGVRVKDVFEEFGVSEDD